MMNSATVGLMVLASAMLIEPAQAASMGRVLMAEDHHKVPTVPPKADIKAKKAPGPPPKVVTPPDIPPNNQTGAKSVKPPVSTDGNEGEEGDEGNEGIDISVKPFQDLDKGKAPEIQGPPRSPLPNVPTQPDTNVEGGFKNKQSNTIVRTRGVCRSNATASTYSEMTDAHVNAVSSVMTEFCRDDFDGELAVASASAKDWGKAIVAVLTTAQAECMTSGQAFGCASASSTAVAWAAASAEAHAAAVASSAEECACIADAESYAAIAGSEFVELIADAMGQAQAQACSKGNQRSVASAFASCGAAAYADVMTSTFARAMLEGECWDTEVATVVGIDIEAQFRSIEGCEFEETTTGAANASADGTADAEAAGVSPDKDEH
eukprot:jgi/Ulvmu1/7377/UM036_0037.1